MNIIINYAEKSHLTGYRVPMSTPFFYPDVYRDRGYTAKLVDFSHLELTSPYGVKIVYEVSFTYKNYNHTAALNRSGAEWARMHRAMENIVTLRLQNTVRYINRRKW